MRCNIHWWLVVVQYTLGPDTLHWFQSGPRGAVLSEFSTRSMDAKDFFTDPEIQRITKVK